MPNLGQSIAQPRPLDLAEICRQSLPLLKVAAPKNIAFAAHLPSVGPTVNADLNQIQQVLTNLVTNAWEAEHESQGTVVVTVKSVSPGDIPLTHLFPIDWQAQDKEYGCLEVSDSGCGLSEPDIATLFDPFFSTKFTGRGLGLAVVLGIVKTHGGAITVESAYGQGSIFRVFLPVTDEKVSQQSDQIRTSPVTTGSRAVLLVEDEEILRDMVTTMLIRCGHTVFAAADGLEAVEIFRQKQDTIDVVLSDLSMPRMDGWATMSALRQIRPDIPVILTSGHDESEFIPDTPAEQPQVFLHKPYQKAMLQEALAKAMMIS